MPFRHHVSARWQSVFPGVLVAALLAVLILLFALGVRRLGETVADGAHAIASPSSQQFGQCGYHLPWPCKDVPSATIAQHFGRSIPPGVDLLAAEANPSTQIGAHAAVQAVLDFPPGSSPSDWLSLAGADASRPASDSEASELTNRGATRIVGGTASNRSVFSGTRGGHVLVWVYGRL